MIRTLALFIFISPLECFAGFSLGIDGTYVYSALSDQGPTSSFSLLVKKSTATAGQAALTFTRWDFVLLGQVSEISMVAPTGQTVNDSDTTTSAFGTGVRYKFSSLWVRLSYDMKDALYLENTATNTYNLATARASFATLNFLMSGRSRNYSVSLEIEAAYPVGTVSTPSGTMKYDYFLHGVGRLDFGRALRFGIVGGVDVHKYSVQYDGYFRTDIFGGISIGFEYGGAKSSRGGGDWSSDGRIPNYPLY